MSDKIFSAGVRRSLMLVLAELAPHFTKSVLEDMFADDGMTLYLKSHFISVCYRYPVFPILLTLSDRHAAVVPVTAIKIAYKLITPKAGPNFYYKLAYILYGLGPNKYRVSENQFAAVNSMAEAYDNLVAKKTIFVLSADKRNAQLRKEILSYISIREADLAVLDCVMRVVDTVEYSEETHDKLTLVSISPLEMFITSLKLLMEGLVGRSQLAPNYPKSLLKLKGPNDYIVVIKNFITVVVKDDEIISTKDVNLSTRIGELSPATQLLVTKHTSIQKDPKALIDTLKSIVQTELKMAEEALNTIATREFEFSNRTDRDAEFQRVEHFPHCLVETKSLPYALNFSPTFDVNIDFSDAEYIEKFIDIHLKEWSGFVSLIEGTFNALNSLPNKNRDVLRYLYPEILAMIVDRSYQETMMKFALLYRSGLKRCISESKFKAITIIDVIVMNPIEEINSLWTISQQPSLLNWIRANDTKLIDQLMSEEAKIEEILGTIQKKDLIRIKLLQAFKGSSLNASGNEKVGGLNPSVHNGG